MVFVIAEQRSVGSNPDLVGHSNNFELPAVHRAHILLHRLAFRLGSLLFLGHPDEAEVLGEFVCRFLGGNWDPVFWARELLPLAICLLNQLVEALRAEGVASIRKDAGNPVFCVVLHVANAAEKFVYFHF